MAERSLHVVTYREDGSFVPQCLNVDIASDGPSADEARDNLCEALALYFDEPGAGPEFRVVSEAQVQQLTVGGA